MPVTTNDQTRVEPHTRPANQGLCFTPLTSTCLPPFSLLFALFLSSRVLPAVTLHSFPSHSLSLTAGLFFVLAAFISLVRVSGGGQGKVTDVFQLPLLFGILAFLPISPPSFVMCFVCWSFKCLLGQGHPTRPKIVPPMVPGVSLMGAATHWCEYWIVNG